MQPHFGDRVRIASSAETDELGIAGLEGHVHGESIPSSSGVGPVIGGLADDYALGVSIDRDRESLWLAPHLVEFLHHGEGTTINLDGGPQWVRTASGEWKPVDDAPARFPARLRSPWRRAR